MDIAGKLAIVTGGASGMGAAVTRSLAKQGAQLVVIDRNQEAALQIAEEVNGQAYGCDVSSSSQLEEVYQKIKTNNSQPLRIVANCAGILQAKRMVNKEGPVALEWFNQVIQVNLVGTFNVMRLSAQAMIQSGEKDQENGIIINTASIAAFEGGIGQSAYSASKGGIVSLTLPAARELAQFGIRVMCIAPGFMDTPMLQGTPEELRSNLQAQTIYPKRLGHTTEFSDLVVHIIQNPLLNGEVIRLDGAVRMR